MSSEKRNVCIAVSIVVLVIVTIIWETINMQQVQTVTTQSLDKAVQIVGKAVNCSDSSLPTLQQDVSNHWYLVCIRN